MTKRLEKTIKLISQMTDDELEQIVQAVKIRWSFLVSQKVLKYKVGQRVLFKGRYSEPVKGTIAALRKKSLKIKADDGVEWQVSPQYIIRKLSG